MRLPFSTALQHFAPGCDARYRLSTGSQTGSCAVNSWCEGLAGSEMDEVSYEELRQDSGVKIPAGSRASCLEDVKIMKSLRLSGATGIPIRLKRRLKTCLLECCRAR